MALISEQARIGLQRHFTVEGLDPYDTVEWVKREAKIANFKTGEVAFSQKDVEVPSGWSLNAVNILAQKYFRGTPGTSQRENSLKQVVDRVVDTITEWGIEDGYFDAGEAKIFSDELRYMIIHQMGAFNSPVWFNIGVQGVPQQASACFILSVEDTMDDILNWYVEEGVIFKGGSGAGVNLSAIRSSHELLKGGGTASGPVSFMRGADASAGTIKSGGKTRRAAKMVILDVDHPDIEEFIWCKAFEERKARVLSESGFDMGIDGSDGHSIQYQNANNSVRVSDAFMQAVVDDGDWDLKARTSGEVIRTVKAREIMRQFAQASWECADPGMQFDSIINHWHTSSNSGKINGSNPCSEYMHLDDSACNLASLNLLKFLDQSGEFNIAGFNGAVEHFFTAQDIMVGRADYPTESISKTSRRFRQLGLGYANLGALLMNLGIPYDSDEGRAYAASVTALMTGRAYNTSTRISARLGPHDGYGENRDPMLKVLGQHSQAVQAIGHDAPPKLLEAAQQVWGETCELAQSAGVRNAQATVLAPTGTIGLLMDCDTTGIEPDLGLVKTKKLVGGGTMMMVSGSVEKALQRLGYSQAAIEKILAHVDRTNSILGAPGIKSEHYPVFACSMGDNTIHYRGHVDMMAAVQPFISGAISKTVNMPEDVTVEDVEQLHIDAWRSGIKAIAIYRDNCKVAQPVSAAKEEKEPSNVIALSPSSVDAPMVKTVYRPIRERLPRDRRSWTFEFRVADCKGYVTVSEYEDGRPGEIFLRVSKQGSTLAGIMDAFAISISHGLQYGVPLRTFVETFTGMRFEPAGMTDDPDIRIATSIMDYLFRKLAIHYLSLEERTSLGIFSTNERTQQTLPGMVEPIRSAGDLPVDPPSIDSVDELALVMDQDQIRPDSSDAPICMQCGIPMQRSGSCHSCPSCGNTSGCS